MHCAKAGDRDQRYTKEFVEAALAFRNAPATNRYREADALQKRLPVTPVKSVTYTGNTSNFAGRGSTFIVYDYDKPSFVLERSEVLRLLGEPADTDSFGYVYLVVKDRKYTKNPKDKYDVTLSIHFHNKYVVNSSIGSSSVPLSDWEETSAARFTAQTNTAPSGKSLVPPAPSPRPPPPALQPRGAR